MKNTLYEIFDRITLMFSPLVEGFFDYAEMLSTRRETRKRKRRVQTTLDDMDARAVPALRHGSFAGS